MLNSASDTVRIACPGCQAAYKISAINLGKQVRCKRCQARFTAAAPGRSNADEGPEPLSLDDAEPSRLPPPATSSQPQLRTERSIKHPRRVRGLPVLWLVVGGVAVSALLAVAVIGSAIRYKSASTRTSNTPTESAIPFAYEMGGVRLGMSFEQLKVAVPNLETQHPEVDMQKTFQNACPRLDPARATAYYTKEVKVADRLVVGVFLVVEGRVAGIITYIDSGRSDLVEAAVRAKYGPPTQTEKTVLNGSFGFPSIGDRLVWSHGDMGLWLTKTSGDSQQKGTLIAFHEGLITRAFLPPPKL